MTGKQISNIQIVGNIAATAIFILFFLGTLVDIKYEFDDPAAHATGDQASQYLYLLLTKFAILFAALIIFNFTMIFILKRKFKISNYR